MPSCALAVLDARMQAERWASFPPVSQAGRGIPYISPKVGYSDYESGMLMILRTLSYTLATALTIGTVSGAGLTVVGTGYSGRGTIQVAPGQITTFLVTGVTIDPTQSQQASSLPLPTHLAGISLTINQPTPKQSLPVPLFSGTQTNTCSNVQSPPSRDCLVTMITAQIPFELVPPSYQAPPQARKS